jgi:hypothetical protein
MNRASAADNSRNRATKSGFTGIPSLQLPEFEGQTPGLIDALSGRHARPELAIQPVVLGAESRLSNGDVWCTVEAHGEKITWASAVATRREIEATKRRT